MAFINFNDANGGGGGNRSELPFGVNYWGPLNLRYYIQQKMEHRGLDWFLLYPRLKTELLPSFDPQNTPLPQGCTCVTISRDHQVQGMYNFGNNLSHEALLYTVQQQCPEYDMDDLKLAFSHTHRFVISRQGHISQKTNLSLGVYGEALRARPRMS